VSPHWLPLQEVLHQIRSAAATTPVLRIHAACGRAYGALLPWPCHTTRHQVDGRSPCDKQLVLAYQITPGEDGLRRPAMLLEFDQLISLGTIGDRFAFHREPTQDERDPTTCKPSTAGELRR
jgi:hypothetical protein